MALTDRENLAIFIFVFFTLSVPPAIIVCRRQGFGRSLGWFYLLTLPFFRIVGGAMTIAAKATETSPGLFAASFILNSLSLISLLLTLLGMIERVNNGMPRTLQKINKGLRLCHLALIANGALIISAGIETAIDHDSGYMLNKASAVITMAVFMILVAATSINALRLKETWVGDRYLLYAAAASFPFLLVRVAYAMALAFATESSAFSALDPSVYAEMFMAIFMECIIIVIYIAVGFKTPSMKQAPADVTEDEPPGVASAHTIPNIRPGNDVELGTLPSRPDK